MSYSSAHTDLSLSDNWSSGTPGTLDMWAWDRMEWGGTRLQDLRGHSLLHNDVRPGAIMGISKVMHMKSIPVITNHMLAYV